jgi:tRNA (guanine37-N1)-methyltransferase
MKLPRLIRQALERAGVGNPERASTGVDVIGDIVIIRMEGLREREKRRTAETLLEELKNVKGVFEQLGGIEGEHRLRSLKHLAGRKETMTLHRENGCVFKVDVARCYFSPRLSTERLRVANEVREGESVLNMFAGVGPFSIPIAKGTSAKVTSCEINSFACELHRTNNRLNKVEGMINVVEGDAMALPDLTNELFDRILMPHPSKADRFLPVALKLANKTSVIHYYRHVLGRDEDEADQNIRSQLAGVLPSGAKVTTRRVRDVGPRWVEMSAEVRFGA